MITTTCPFPPAVRSKACVNLAASSSRPIISLRDQRVPALPRDRRYAQHTERGAAPGAGATLVSNRGKGESIPGQAIGVLINQQRALGGAFREQPGKRDGASGQNGGLILRPRGQDSPS